MDGGCSIQRRGQTISSKEHTMSKLPSFNKTPFLAIKQRFPDGGCAFHSFHEAESSPMITNKVYVVKALHYNAAGELWFRSTYSTFDVSIVRELNEYFYYHNPHSLTRNIQVMSYNNTVDVRTMLLEYNLTKESRKWVSFADDSYWHQSDNRFIKALARYQYAA